LWIASSHCGGSIDPTFVFVTLCYITTYVLRFLLAESRPNTKQQNIVKELLIAIFEFSCQPNIVNIQHHFAQHESNSSYSVVNIEIDLPSGIV
jgi:hypothetical protein